MIGYSKAKLLGRPFRYEADFADSGGSIGDRYGGGGGGGEGGGFGGGFAGTEPERSDLADLNAGTGASLTGGNLATGGVGFGFAPGPVTTAEAADWADNLAGDGAPADSIIVVQPKPTVIETILQALIPLQPVTIAPNPVASVTLERTTTVDIGQLLNNAATGILSVLGIVSGTPSGVIGGARGLSGVVGAPSAFGETITETVSMPGEGGGEVFGGSPAPSVFAAGESRTSAADTGGTAGDAGDNVSGSPVLGFGGTIVNDAPQATTTGAGLGGLSQALAGLFAAPANTRQRYAASVGAQPQQAAPAIPPALALAGLAGLIFLG